MFFPMSSLYKEISMKNKNFHNDLYLNGEKGVVDYYDFISKDRIENNRK